MSSIEQDLGIDGAFDYSGNIKSINEEKKVDAPTALNDFRQILTKFESSPTSKLLNELQSCFSGLVRKERRSTETLELFFQKGKCTICCLEVKDNKHRTSDGHVRKVLCLRLHVIIKSRSIQSLKEIIELFKTSVKVDSSSQPHRYLMDTKKSFWGEIENVGLKRGNGRYDGARLWFQDLLANLRGIFRDFNNTPEFHELGLMIAQLGGPATAAAVALLPAAGPLVPSAQPLTPSEEFGVGGDWQQVVLPLPRLLRGRSPDYCWS